MCNEQRYTESGAPIAPTRCAEYVALKEENARLHSIMDKARAVSASWEQYKAAGVDGQDEVAPFLESGLNRLVVEIDKYDALKEVG